MSFTKTPISEFIHYTFDVKTKIKLHNQTKRQPSFYDKRLVYDEYN